MRPKYSLNLGSILSNYFLIKLLSFNSYGGMPNDRHTIYKCFIHVTYIFSGANIYKKTKYTSLWSTNLCTTATIFRFILLGDQWNRPHDSLCCMEICPPEKLTNVSHFISRGLFCNYQKDVAARRAATSMFWFKENQRPLTSTASFPSSLYDTSAGCPLY